jgi:anti-sigma B factor antagonist
MVTGRALHPGGEVELSVVTRREGARMVIGVTGEIDVYTAPTLRERLNELVAEGEYNLIVDMAGVDFLDSTGLGVLVGGLKRTRSHHGTLRLVCAQEKILKVFRITGLTKVFPIHATLEEALAVSDRPASVVRLDGEPHGDEQSGGSA